MISVALTIDDRLCFIVCVRDAALVYGGMPVALRKVVLPITLVVVSTDVLVLDGGRTLIRWLG